MSRLTEIAARAAAATPAPWLEREDEDYYQGGTYLGIGPLRYVPDPKSPWGGRTSVPCAPGDQEYFETDVCRIQSGDADKVFIQHAREDVPWLLAVVQSLLAVAQAASARYGDFADADDAQGGSLGVALDQLATTVPEWGTWP